MAHLEESNANGTYWRQLTARITTPREGRWHTPSNPRNDAETRDPRAYLVRTPPTSKMNSNPFSVRKPLSPERRVRARLARAQRFQRDHALALAGQKPPVNQKSDLINRYQIIERPPLTLRRVGIQGLDWSYELRLGSRTLARPDNPRQAMAEVVVAALASLVTDCAAMQQSICSQYPELEGGDEGQGPTDADFAAFWEAAKRLGGSLPTEIGDQWRRGWPRGN